MASTMASSIVRVDEISIGNTLPLVLIAGPCQMESRQHALECAAALKEISVRLGIKIIFKSSFDKANRTSIRAERGIGMSSALEVFADIRQDFNMPVLTDIHERQQCSPVAQVVDILQIPAFLCRQTDLILAAVSTGRAVNIKKGQFLAPWDVYNIIDKARSTSNERILITERGTSFGYNTLVSDMRSLPIMASFDIPVIFDATHSVQQPGGLGATSGGQREFVGILARAAVAVGVAGVFIESHPDPDHAPSDGPNMIALKDLEPLVADLMEYDRLTKSRFRTPSK